MSECNWCFTACGEEPLAAVKQHLAGCSDCQKDLAEQYEVYKEYRHHPGNPYAYLPQDLAGPEEFLTALAAYETRKGEVAEHLRQLLKNKFAEQPSEMISALHRLFSRIHHGLRLTSLPVKEKQVDLIRSAYQDLLSLLGRSPFSFLLGLHHLMEEEKADPLVWLSERWRKVLLPESGD